MPFAISTDRVFSAGHQLVLYDGSLEPMHGHNWRVRVTVTRATLDGMGVVMDFHELERLVDTVVMPWHNRHLNDCEPFAGQSGLNPSAENVALHIGRAVGATAPPHVLLASVEVWETAENRAIYRPPE